MILDPVQAFLVAHPWAVPLVMVASYALSAFAPMIASKWPWLAKPLDIVMHLLGALPGRVPATAEAAMSARKTAIPPSAPLMLCMVLALFGCGCTSTEKQIAKTVLDVGNAVCSEVSPQTSSEYVDLVCSAVSVADGVSHVFLVRMRPVDAAAIKAKAAK